MQNNKGGVKLGFECIHENKEIKQKDYKIHLECLQSWAFDYKATLSLWNEGFLIPEGFL